MKKAVIEKSKLLIPVVKNSKNAKIVAGVLAFALIVLLIVSYFPRGTLEVTVTDIYGELKPGTEVWIWDRDDFKGKPEKNSWKLMQMVLQNSSCSKANTQ